MLPLEIPRDAADAMIAHCRARSSPRVLRHPGRSAAARLVVPSAAERLASETRYHADPQDLIQAIVDSRAAGPRSWRSITPTRAGRPSPAATDLRENHYGRCRASSSRCLRPPDVRVWRLDPDSLRRARPGGSSSTRRPACRRLEIAS